MIRKTASRIAMQLGGDAGGCIEILEVREGPSSPLLSRVIQRLAPTRSNSKFAARWLVDWGMSKNHSNYSGTDLIATLSCFGLPPITLEIRWGPLYAAGESQAEPFSQGFQTANTMDDETPVQLAQRQMAATEMRAYQARKEAQLRDLARTWDEAYAVVGS